MADLLWGVRTGGSRGPKPALTLDAIAEAAIRVADADGLVAASMQRVAAELGFTKMALYRYLPGKSELLALMVEHALGGPPDLGAVTWRQGLRTWAHALLAAHLRHPWTLEAVLLPRPLGPNEVHWMETAAALLANSGLTGAERLDTFTLLIGQVRVIAQHARPIGSSEEQFVAVISNVLAAHGEHFPALAESVSQAAADDAGRDQAFDFGIERILDGLQSLIEVRGRQVGLSTRG